MADASRVFLSYSHDSAEHADRVLALAYALCDDGIDVTLDRYVYPAPAEGWPRWMERNLDEAQFVLMVCTETYRRRVLGREEPGRGLGVRWEGSLIYNQIYNDKPSGSRFIPILLPGSEPAHIPNPVQGHAYYRITAFDLTDPGFAALYRHLTDQPATLKPDLGEVVILPPKSRPQAVPGHRPPSGGPMINIEGVASPPRIVPRKLFISYAHGDPDQTLAQALSDGLCREGHEVFIDTAISLGADWGSMITEKIMASDFLVLLLSARSVHSEMVREEARIAHSRHKAEGVPRLLPVRIAYSGPLGYALGAWVNPYQWATWEAPGDTARVLQQILDVITGQAEAPAPAASPQAGPAPADDFHRPEPMADLSDTTAPGGAIRHDDPFYIKRAADREVLAIARRLEETVVIKAPRQMGKSSLLKRYLAECRRAKKKTALIDLSLFDDTSLADYPTFLTSFAEELLDRFGLEGSPTIAGQPAMSRFVRDRLLKAVPDNLVIALDEVDRVLGRYYHSNFFSMLRYWNEGRTDAGQPEWARLELALVISTEPYLLIDDSRRSPFNIRIPIVLTPFNADECRELNRRYGQVLRDDQAERLRSELLDGHPFLTRLAYYRLTRPDASGFDALLRDAAQPEGPFGDHLRALLVKLRQSTKPDLLAALRQVIQHGTAPDDNARDRLQAAGLVRRGQDKVVPANGLYARFFGGPS